MWSRALLPVIALAWGACGAPFTGSTDLTSGGAGGAAETSSSAGDAPSACALCAPLAGEDWNGPALRLLGDEAEAGCGDTDLLRGGRLVEAPPATCTCACLPACTQPTVTQTAPGCMAFSLSPMTLNYGCTKNPLKPANGPFSYQLASMPAEKCPARSAVALGAAVVSQPVALCRTTVSRASCAAGTCLNGTPLGDTAALCIFKDGVASCPDDYPERELLATTPATMGNGLKDDRRCSPCSCGKPDGNKPCKVSVLGYASDDCKGDSVGSKLTSDECIDAATWPMTAKSVFATLSGPTCQPSGGEPIGDAVPTEGAVTLCCMR